ncbi:energy-coupling factor ABC transporter ATP-binding protein [Bacillus infantis]|uniref:energy-coupling factor ABC transporter ATP-binding protein n=1 Tax=Bacillus infantis TaxID=324767 RepID=UPI003CF6769A
MKEPFLYLDHVSYKYGDGTPALSEITISIEHGRKIALLGNNGAGKSTLLCLLNGIIKPSKGCLYYKGRKLSHTRKEIRQLRQKVGIVFQNSDSQLFSSSVYEDIAFGPRNLDLDPQEMDRRVQLAMELTETEELKEKPPHLLSIGQKKRVAIAGVAAMHPELLVLDEPFAGLDPYYQRKIGMLLEKFSEQSKTILLSTHDVDFAYEWADEIILLHNGRLLFQGTPKEVFRKRDSIEKCHLQMPWILEIFDRLQQTDKESYKHIPGSKEELFDMMKAIGKGSKAEILF